MTAKFGNLGIGYCLGFSVWNFGFETMESHNFLFFTYGLFYERR